MDRGGESFVDRPTSGGNRLRLAGNEGLGELTVGFSAFLEFSYDIAEGLADLVAVWAPFAAPMATRRQNGDSLAGLLPCSLEPLGEIPSPNAPRQEGPVPYQGPDENKGPGENNRPDDAREEQSPG